MDNAQRFWDAIKNDMSVTLATAEGQSVTMRAVSPVLYNGAVLMFTSSASTKYRQLKANHNCCIMAGDIYAQCRARFLGAAMLPENGELREVYDKKFPAAFDEDVDFGGRGAEFILLSPVRLTGWGFKDGVPTGDGIPNEPFEVELA